MLHYRHENNCLETGDSLVAQVQEFSCLYDCLLVYLKYYILLGVMISSGSCEQYLQVELCLLPQIFEARSSQYWLIYETSPCVILGIDEDISCPSRERQ